MSLEYLGISLSNVKEIVTAIGGILTFTYTVFLIGRKFGGGKKVIGHLEAIIQELKRKITELQKRVDSIDALVLGRDDFWVRSPATPFDMVAHRGEISGSIPIISVVNFKGGVGKTTICANLAGYFAKAGKRVVDRLRLSGLAL